MRYLCAWAGCTASTEHPPGHLPPRWIFLATFRETVEPGVLNFMHDKVERDAVLCPEHHEELERCLTDIGIRRRSDA